MSGYTEQEFNDPEPITLHTRYDRAARVGSLIAPYGEDFQIRQR
jgi:hypothetical protein